MLQKILLASHGTLGAQAAERYVFANFSSCSTLHHLCVVPDCWKGMMGDDWLNNAATQAEFGRYLEQELDAEIAVNRLRVQSACEAKLLAYQFHLEQGDPAQVLIALAASDQHDLVVMGTVRPKSVLGLRSRMNVSLLQQKLRCPLLIVPFG